MAHDLIVSMFDYQRHMRFEKSDQSKALSNRVVEIRVIDFFFPTTKQKTKNKKKRLIQLQKVYIHFSKLLLKKKIPFPSSIDQSLLTYKVVDLSLTDD